MRAENLHSQLATTPIPHPAWDESPDPPPSPHVAATERTAMTSLPIFRTLQSQVDRLWREIRQLELRAERPDSENPPSYAERDVSHNGGGVGS
jgi:hypothetical protein